MTVTVTFFTPKGVGSIDAPGVGDIRAREAVTIGSSTTNTVQDGEVVTVYNGETGAILIAHGSTPDAQAATATAATTAGFPVAAAGLSPPIRPLVGSKINAKVIP